MDVRCVNNVSFNARLQFGEQNRKSGLIKQGYDLCYKAGKETIVCAKRSFMLIACFSFIMSKIISAKNNVKLPN